VVAEALLHAADIRWVACCPEIAGEDAGAVAAQAAEAGITVNMLSRRAFEALSDTRSPQGLAAVVRARRADLSALIPEAEAFTVLVLHDVRDPGNVGSMIRSADALGATGIIMVAHCADPWEPKAVRATAGSLFHLPVALAGWRQVSAWARDNAIGVVAAVATGHHVLGKADLPPRCALVIGNEAHGLPPEVLQDAALAVRIPMLGHAESLNASAAAAILLYEAAARNR
jgi:RNA methyltransferase, TrmH family